MWACRGSVGAALGRDLLQGLVLLYNRFEPRNVFQQALAGQDQEVIAELRVLKVDFQKLFVSDGQHVPVFDAFDRRGSSVIGRQKTKFAHQPPRWELDVNFLDQEFSGDGQQHFVGGIVL